jgi:thiol:disulfide interchange protein
MSGSAAPSAGLSTLQKLLLLASALLLAGVLFLLRGGLTAESPMDQLARRSALPEEAFANHRPTLIEFYADWCEVCRDMAPAMLANEQRYRDQLNVVLLNVDNPRWQDLIDRYDVNGIPQLNLFDAEAQPRGRSLGRRSQTELEALSEALIHNSPLPLLAGVGDTTPLTPETVATTAPSGVGPRSHG